MNYTALHYLMNEKHCVVEISINNKCQWLSISKESNKVEKLVLKNSDKELVSGNQMNVKTFKNAELRYDNLFGKFVIRDHGFILMNCSEELIPTEIDELIIKAQV